MTCSDKVPQPGQAGRGYNQCVPYCSNCLSTFHASTCYLYFMTKSTGMQIETEVQKKDVMCLRLTLLPLRQPQTFVLSTLDTRVPGFDRKAPGRLTHPSRAHCLVPPSPGHTNARQCFISHVQETSFLFLRM